jgi:uncharacterized short protein YbdD (DUF466 family)
VLSSNKALFKDAPSGWIDSAKNGLKRAANYIVGSDADENTLTNLKEKLPDMPDLNEKKKELKKQAKAKFSELNEKKDDLMDRAREKLPDMPDMTDKKEQIKEQAKDLSEHARNGFFEAEPLISPSMC